MKKTLTAFTLAALMVSGSVVFAQANPNPQQQTENASKQKFNRHKNHKKFDKNFCMNHGNDKNVIIGQVKSINTKDSVIKVTNADGKDVDVKVTPFSKVVFTPTGDKMPKRERKELKQQNDSEKVLPPMMKEHSISEIKTGSWVIISTFNTETKNQVASCVFVKQEIQPSKPVVIDEK